MSLLPSEPDTSAVDETDPRVIDVDSEDADDVFAALSSSTARQVLTALHDEPAPPAELAERVDTSLQNTQYHLEKLEDAGAIQVIDQIYSEKGREMNVYAPADQPLVIFAGDEEGSTGLRAALSRFLGSLGILALASVVIQELFGDGVTELFGGSGGGGSREGATAPAAAPAANDTATPTPTPAPEARDTAADSAEGGDGGGVQIAEAPDTETARETAQSTYDSAANGTAEATRTAAETATTTARNATDAGSTAADAAAAGLGLEPGLVFFLGGLTTLAVVSAVWYATR